MEQALVKTETNERIALVTIDNPPVNAFSQEVKAELGQCFEELGAQRDIAAVILTGAGEKTFMAGADIKQLKGICHGVHIMAIGWEKKVPEIVEQAGLLPRTVL